MVLARFEKPITDAAGNLITTPGFMFEVRREDAVGAPFKPMYSDRDGLAPLDNPASVVDGIAAFHGVGGPFRLRVYGPGYDKTFRYLAIGTGAEVDVNQLLAPGYLLEFETALIAPPGAACVRVNNASFAAADRLFISKENTAGSDIAALLAALLNTRVLLTSQNAGEQASWYVSAVTDHTGYAELTVAGHAGADAFVVAPVTLQREGADGAVASLVEGDGIEIDDTDPANPIVKLTTQVRASIAITNHKLFGGL